MSTAQKSQTRVVFHVERSEIFSTYVQLLWCFTWNARRRTKQYSLLTEHEDPKRGPRMTTHARAGTVWL